MCPAEAVIHCKLAAVISYYLTKYSTVCKGDTLAEVVENYVRPNNIDQTPNLCDRTIRRRLCIISPDDSGMTSLNIDRIKYQHWNVLMQYCWW